MNHLHPSQYKEIVGWLQDMLTALRELYPQAYDYAYSAGRGGEDVKVTNTSKMSETERVATEAPYTQRRKDLEHICRLTLIAKDNMLGAQRAAQSLIGKPPPTPIEKRRQYERGAEMSEAERQKWELYKQKRDAGEGLV